MKNDLDGKLIGVLRIRGRIGVRASIKETLKRLNLDKVNNLVVLYGTKSNIGMIIKSKDYVTFGEIDDQILSDLVVRAGKKATKEELADVMSGKKSIKEIVDMPFRMHPPRKGYEAIKYAFSNGGSLGYRGKEINDLVKRMYS